MAAASGDRVAIRKLLGPTVRIGGPIFNDPRCAAFGNRKVDGIELDGLAACLADLRWHSSRRIAASPQMAVLESVDGYELQSWVDDDGHLTSIGFTVRAGASDPLPTLAPTTFEALRAGDQELAPDVAASLADEHPAFAWLKVCIDEKGAAIPRLLVASSPHAGEVFVTAARTWTFQPYTRQGQPTAACAALRVQHPRAIDFVEQLPADIALRGGKQYWTLKPQELETHRRSGDRNIVPDDADKIHLNGKKLIGSYKLCLDEQGRVQEITILRPTGVPGYDRRIVRTMFTWQYEPVVLDGAPRPVCTAVTFIYQQDGNSIGHMRR